MKCFSLSRATFTDQIQHPPALERAESRSTVRFSLSQSRAPPDLRPAATFLSAPPWDTAEPPPFHKPDESPHDPDRPAKLSRAWSSGSSLRALPSSHSPDPPEHNSTTP